MLRTRIITAFISLPIVLLILFVAPEKAFAISVGGILLVGAWEWIRLSFSGNFFNTATLLVIFSVLMIGCYQLSQFYSLLLISSGCLFWIGALAIVLTYPSSRSQFDNKYIKLAFGLLVLIPPYVALLYLRRHESHLLLIAFLVSITCAADVAAYFVGRIFGNSKLAPNISPGKSWAGVFGGIVGALTVGAIGVSLGKSPDHFFSLAAWVVLMVIVTITVLCSILGDLFESLIKREAGVKDSSALLPGHGGVMDRIDSLTAATPVFTLITYFIDWPWL